MSILHKSTTAFVLGAGLALAPLQAAAQYPERPVTFVVPWPPGDLEDVLTRLIADAFQARHGVAAAVVNRPGGGGGPFPGAISVAEAPADGYTVGSFVNPVVAVGPFIGIPELDPDPFEPLGAFLTYPFLLAARGDAPFSSLEELAAHAKDNSVALGHFGARAAPTRVSFALAQSFGFEWGGDAAFDALDCNTLASGDADVINTTVQLVLPCLGELKILASYTSERISILPEVPTAGELVPELDLFLWNGLFVRKGTPDDAKAAIIEAAREAVASGPAQDVARTTGAQVYWLGPEETAARIEGDIATFQRINEMLDD